MFNRGELNEQIFTQASFEDTDKIVDYSNIFYICDTSDNIGNPGGIYMAIVRS